MKHLLAILVLLALAIPGVVATLLAADTPKTQPRPSQKPPELVMTTQPATPTVTHTDDEWKKLLTPEQYRILRGKGTERAFTGEYDKTFTPGTYACAACGQELFSSDTKFDARCGWPAFFAAKAGDRVTLTKDTTAGMTRIEVTCSRCASHLGHVFPNETHEIGGKEEVVNRFCINSVSLKFIPAKPAPATQGSETAKNPGPEVTK